MMSRSPRTALLLATLAVVMTACEPAGPPPITVEFRDSLVGAGKVVRLENGSNEPLSNVEVQLLAPDGERRIYVAPRLDGYASVEIGWRKLGGWQIPEGCYVEVRADGHRRAVRAKAD